MNKLLRFTIASFSLLMLTVSTQALDLPIRKVNGKEVYCYKVKNKETVYGVSKKLGVTREEIVRYNPSASDGLKKNMMLFFPVDGFKDRDMVEDIVDNTAPEVVDTIVVEESNLTVTPVAGSKILILLPFGGLTEQEERKAKFNKDFYRGFLLAADSLSNRPGNVEIETFDLSTKPISEITASDAFKNASVIIGPEDEKSLETIADAAKEQGSYVLNVLNMRDTTYVGNPFMVQANIPHTAMYDLASKAVEENFPGFTPVILRSENGKNEKEPFVNFLRKRFLEHGIVPIEIIYDKSLHMNDLAALNIDNGEKYVVIPSSGSLSEFNNTSHVLKSFRDKIYISAETDSISLLQPELAVFGYPDWTAFRGDALDMLHKLDATVYSRFCDDFNGFDTKNIDNEYRQWYGGTMMESVPTPCLLGFDTGWYLIKNLRSNQGAFDPVIPFRNRGIQSVFQFNKPTEDSGYVNSALFIIKYQPDGRMEVRVI